MSADCRPPRVPLRVPLCVPTRVFRHHPLRPPERRGCKTQACGLCRGKRSRRRFKLFRSAGDRASAALGCGFGRERPKVEPESRVEPGLPYERRWRRHVPEIHFQGRRSPSSCSGESVLCSPLGQAQGPRSSRTGLETPPQPTAAEGWRRLQKTRSAGQDVIMKAPRRPFSKALRASGSFRDRLARWKILKYILCVL